MSPRITKETAKTIAKILTAKKLKAVEDANKAVSVFITGVVKSKLPTLVETGFAKFPDYFRCSSSVYVNGEGIAEKWNSVRLTETVPQSDSSVELKGKNASQFVALRNAEKQAKHEYETVLREVENALINCRTYEGVKKHFPEAIKHLPVVYPVPAVNFEQVRKKLK